MRHRPHKAPVIERYPTNKTVPEPTPPDAEAAARMDWSDERWTPEERALMHEFGQVIVNAMLEDGETDMQRLKHTLMHWQLRRQEEWLRTNFIDTRTADAIKKTLVRAF